MRGLLTAAVLVRARLRVEGDFRIGLSTILLMLLSFFDSVCELEFFEEHSAEHSFYFHFKK